MFSVKHFLHCVTFYLVILFYTRTIPWLIHRIVFILIWLVEGLLTIAKHERVISDPIKSYGYLGTGVLYFSKLQFIPLLPFAVCTFFGLVLYNSFPGKVKLKKPIEELKSFVCVRLVTRGDFPELVKENTFRNVKACLAVGLKNFCVEVATAKEIDLPSDEFIRQVIVPTEYKPKNGALFKARQLQYCLERDVLKDDDWIVHLDEDSVLTEDGVRGVVNFIQDGRYPFGTGLITFDNEGINSSLASLLNSLNVVFNLATVQFQFRQFHKPIFGWRGSFLVCKVSGERDVSFDFGPEGSITEDICFALKAYQKGYEFNFVEGEVWEQSPLTVSDLIRQRERWFRGMINVSKDPSISYRYKLLFVVLGYSYILMPVSVACYFLLLTFPLPPSPILDFVQMFTVVVLCYMRVFAILKSYSPNRIGWFKFSLFLLYPLVFNFIEVVVTLLASFYVLVQKEDQFYVVQKQVPVAANHSKAE